MARECYNNEDHDLILIIFLNIYRRVKFKRYDKLINNYIMSFLIEEVLVIFISIVAFLLLYKYKKKMRLRKKIYLQFEDAVNKKDYTMIDITTKRYLKWK
jgi:hypothetical protein